MTSTDDTPDLYRKWAAITLVSGSLERRVWTQVGYQAGKPRLAYPNLYIFLVGGPGTGKYIIEDVQTLWRETTEPGTKSPAFHLSPSSVTKAALMDAVARSTKSFLPPSGPPYEYTCMLVAAEEFGVFLTSYENDFITLLNKVYNSPETYTEERRYGKSPVIEVIRPIITMIGGVQPVWLGSIFPKDAWGMGLASRIIMVFAGNRELTNPFAEGLDRPIERIRLREKLGLLSQLYGEIKWESDALEKITQWHMAGGPPIPTHPKLEYYCNRRTLHVIKLSIISSVSRTHKVGMIDVLDVNRALEWLVEAEHTMPDIFKAMEGRSDRDVLDELYIHVSGLFVGSHKPVQEARLVAFLATRTTSDKVMKVIEIAERSNMIVRTAGTDLFVPRPRTEWQVD